MHNIEIDLDASAQEFLELYKDELSRLDMMNINLKAGSLVKYTYGRLKSLEINISTESLFEVDSLTSALVITYGRLFTSASGSTKLKEKNIPVEFRPIHDEIMKLRHEMYAHHGGHPRIETCLVLEVSDQVVEIRFDINQRITLGAPEHWGGLIEWLDEYLTKIVESQLEQLSRISGKSCRWMLPPNQSRIEIA